MLKKLMLIAITLVFLAGCSAPDGAAGENTDVSPDHIVEGRAVIDDLYFEDIGSFSLDDYTYELENWAPNDEFEKTATSGETSTAKQAALKAEKAWDTLLWPGAAEDHKPYKIYYDKTNKAWLVLGEAYEQELEDEDIDNSYCGGQIYVMIDEETGELLALWGED